VLYMIAAMDRVNSERHTAGESKVSAPKANCAIGMVAMELTLKVLNIKIHVEIIHVKQRS
jgi:hypothetical protein